MKTTFFRFLQNVGKSTNRSLTPTQKAKTLAHQKLVGPSFGYLLGVRSGNIFLTRALLVIVCLSFPFQPARLRNATAPRRPLIRQTTS